MKTLIDVLNSFGDLKNETIVNNIIIAWSKINSPLYKNIGCSISGGADSDIMLDIVYKCDKDKKVKYFWFDTGLEYQATKDHINYLENKYNIEIARTRAEKTIPTTAREYGEPFISKFVSQMINALQRHNFKWEDKSYNELIKEYPNAKSYISWWCNNRDTKTYGYSMFNINYNKYLKEFLIAHPPTFKISDKCCYYAKKQLAKEISRDYNLDLFIIGIRKSEGGKRSVAYKNCFDEYNTSINTAEYRPLFYYTNKDKEDYENNQNIIHSNCYKKYGFKRTGCVGCPYGHVNGQLWYDLEKIKEYEPQLYKAVSTVFKNSYEYTKAYYAFRKEMELKKPMSSTAEKRATPRHYRKETTQ